MSNSYLIHVDTSSPTTVTPTTSGTTGQPRVSKVNGNPFQCSIILGNRHRGIRSISLKNAQIPIGFYTIRPPFDTMNINSTVTTVASGFYTSNTAVFLSAMNTSVGSKGTFTIGNTAKAPFIFTPGTPTTATLTVPPSSLLSFMGFTNGQTATSQPITAPYASILNIDTYISIWIENMGQSSLEPSQTTFKIPINVQPGAVQYWNELNNNVQKVLVTDRGVRFDRLNITVLDRFGNILDNNGLDWSFTLEIEADN